MVGVKEKGDILFEDYPDCKVTEETIDFINNHPQYYSGNVKLMQGKIFTDEEYKAYKERILNSRLPR
jgi:hypothetical protein